MSGKRDSRADPPERPDDDADWIDTVVKLAGALGFNQVRVRWKLQNWRNRWQASKARAYWPRSV